MATKIQHRRDTASNWTSNNPVANSGEWCLETDTGKVKIGDGTTAWTSLAYVGAASVIADEASPTLGADLDLDGSAIKDTSGTNTNNLELDIQEYGATITMDADKNKPWEAPLHLDLTSSASFDSNADYHKMLSLTVDGSYSGHIGTKAGNLGLVTNAGGLKVEGTRIVPCNSSMADYDDSVDLGQLTNRFRSLVLQGWFYHGGKERVTRTETTTSTSVKEIAIGDCVSYMNQNGFGSGTGSYSRTVEFTIVGHQPSTNKTHVEKIFASVLGTESSGNETGVHLDGTDILQHMSNGSLGTFSVKFYTESFDPGNDIYYNRDYMQLEITPASSTETIWNLHSVVHSDGTVTWTET